MCARKYIRFMVPRRARLVRGADYGIFGPAGAYRDWRYTPEWLRKALAEEIDWFNWNLPVPDRFGVVTRRSRRPYAGICWFRDEARESIAHAHALSALLGECGVPVARVVSDNPGDIVYRDDHQIVAMPHPTSPTLWH